MALPRRKKAGGSYGITTGRLKEFSDTECTMILEDGTSIFLLDVAGLGNNLLHSYVEI